MNYKELLAEIDKQKRLRDMTNKDLAKATRLAESTINGFMGGNRFSKQTAEKICKVLDIPEHMAS
ncbi:MAG: helix-turn-helix domain-containing protein [Ruminococcaceae bacterium]|nr:helix-turn-helix domain-containing protein [Oscillospiraceae bacterium]